MRLRSHLPHLSLGLFLTTAVCSTAAAQDAQPKPDSQPPASPQWRSVIESARPSVVVIRTDTGQGSGFLIKSDGTIATNAHVIAGSSAIEVKLSTGEIYRRVFVLVSDEGGACQRLWDRCSQNLVSFSRVGVFHKKFRARIA